MKPTPLDKTWKRKMEWMKKYMHVINDAFSVNIHIGYFIWAKREKGQIANHLGRYNIPYKNYW